MYSYLGFSGIVTLEDRNIEDLKIALEKIRADIFWHGTNNFHPMINFEVRVLSFGISVTYSFSTESKVYLTANPIVKHEIFNIVERLKSL